MQGSMVLSGQRLSSGPQLCCTRTLQAQMPLQWLAAVLPLAAIRLPPAMQPLDLDSDVQAPSTSVRHSQPFLVENRVVIRFQRGGRKKLPFFRIVAIDSKTRREGVPIERLGWYNPLNKETNLNAPAIKKWLSTGAKPTEAAARILKRAMVIDSDAPITS